MMFDLHLTVILERGKYEGNEEDFEVFSIYFVRHEDVKYLAFDGRALYKITLSEDLFSTLPGDSLEDLKLLELTKYRIKDEYLWHPGLAKEARNIIMKDVVLQHPCL